MYTFPIFKTAALSFKRTITGGDLLWLFIKYLGAIIFTVLLTVGLLYLFTPFVFKGTTDEMLSHLPFIIAISLFSLTLLSTFIINYIRLVNLKVLNHDFGKEGYFKSTFGRKNFVYALQFLKIFGIFIGLIALNMGLFFLPPLISSDLGWLSVVLIILSGFFSFYVMLRLWLFGVVAALETQSPLKTSWAMGKGNVLRFMGMIMALVLIFLLLLIPVVGMHFLELHSTGVLLTIMVFLSMPLHLVINYIASMMAIVAVPLMHKAMLEKKD